MSRGRYGREFVRGRRGKLGFVPVVNPVVGERFLAREFDSHDWIKEIPREQMLAFAHSDLGYRFASEPWNNQLACFLLGAQFPHFLFFVKVGGGKSKIILDLLRLRKRQGRLKRGLILAPAEVHLASWEDQIREHAPDLSYSVLTGTRAQRERELERSTDICLSMYKTLESFMSELDEEDRKKKVIVEKARDFASRFNFLEGDESHNLGNHDTLVFRSVDILAQACDFRYMTSGTPFGRDPTRLFGQFFLADRGETLGRTLGLFRNVFFRPHRSSYALEWTFRQELAGELRRVIKHRSISYEKRELADLPRKLSIRLPCRMSVEQQGYYRRIVDGVKEARGDYKSLDSAFIRMRQCASGFVSLRADDSSRIQFAFRENPKLDALHDFLIERPDEKMLLFHEFRISAEMIEAMLNKARIRFVSLRGGSRDVASTYKQFLDEPSIKIFLLQNQVGSEAINPQEVCRRVILYESPTSPTVREQIEGRIERQGQEERMFVHDMVMLGTIEEKLAKYVKEGRDLLQAVLSGEEELE